MNPAPDEFAKLRKLLALKRHEQPPPGYFQNFSRQVIQRLQDAEGDAEGAGLLRFWHLLTARPLLSGFVTTGACAALVVGLMLLREPDAAPAATWLNSGHGLPAATAVGARTTGSLFDHLAGGPAPASPAQEANSTNPVVLPGEPPSLFGPPRLSVEKTSFTPHP